MYKVFIPTAGLGSRLGDLTKNLNKSLVSIGFKPAICYQIELFQENIEFVVALGYKGELVREFLTLAYPNRKIQFIDIDLYEGEGSGLGLTMLKCSSFLQCPFIFISCDALLMEEIKPPTYNWMGYKNIKNDKDYRRLKIFDKDVIAIEEKNLEMYEGSFPYIGVAGIYDYSEFWSGMFDGGYKAINIGEVYGLGRLLDYKKIRAIEFDSWEDTGNLSALDRAKDKYSRKQNYNILEKENEAIWFVDNRVIKYSNDKNFIASRIKRAQNLGSYVPQITSSSIHMYEYGLIPGTVLSEVITPALFENFLKYCEGFWEIKKLSLQEENQFNSACNSFYKNKTIERIQLFYKVTGLKDGRQTINGIPMKSLDEMLQSVDWKYLQKGYPSRYHGDFHFENIIYDQNSQKFTFIDWRQDFSGYSDIGDLYYDLAKLLHGIIVNHGIVAKNQFSVDWNDESISFHIQRKASLIDCENILYKWCEVNNFDLIKVRLLTSLIFLNIAALHHHPYSLMLFSLGKSMLNNSLREYEHLNKKI